MKGVRFLQDGIAYNETAPQLIKYLGWVISQKIGIADEKVQYRRLFREDNDFHGPRPLDERDNWLVGRQYYLEAERVAEREQMVDKMNPLVFLFLRRRTASIMPSRWRTKGSSKRRLPWLGPSRIAIGRSSGADIRTGDETIRLSDRDTVKRRIEELTAELDQFPPANKREDLLKDKLRQADRRRVEGRSDAPLGPYARAVHDDDARATKVANYARRVGGSCRNESAAGGPKNRRRARAGRIHLANDRALAGNDELSLLAVALRSGTRARYSGNGAA